MKSIIASLRSRRKFNRKLNSRIRYKEALLALKAYENSELKLAKMIDNVRNPKKSLSKHCQVPGCGMAIRYEYILQSKVTKEIMVAGSTCVWTLLGLSEEQIKSFDKLERTIRDFHELVDWKKKNPDVWDKIQQLKVANIAWFKPFWQEVEYLKLCDEDTDYIRGIDVAEEIKKEEARKASRAKYGWGASKWSSNEAKKDDNGNVVNDMAVTQETDEGYKRVLDILNELIINNPNDVELDNMRVISKGSLLNSKQIYQIKVAANKDYFEKKVKGTLAERDYDSCEKDIFEAFRFAVDNKAVKVYVDDVGSVKDDSTIAEMIKKYRRQFNTWVETQMGGSDKVMKHFWKMFRIKYEIIIK